VTSLTVLEPREGAIKVSLMLALHSCISLPCQTIKSTGCRQSGCRQSSECLGLRFHGFSFICRTGHSSWS